MAKTNKIARHMKAVHVLEGMLLREGHRQPAALYLMEMRLRRARALPTLPERRLIITMAFEDGPDDIPKVVKITHR